MNKNKDWNLVYGQFETKHEPLREALTTLGNGYFCIRGAAEEASADDTHYPGTYLAGGYNTLDSVVAGRTISNEDLVNFPNCLPLSFRPEGGRWLNLQAVEILSYKQELNLREGVLTRSFRIRDHDSRETTVSIKRFVSMADPHVVAIEYCITPENWSGELTISSGIDGSVINAGVERYRDLNSKHLSVIDKDTIGDDCMHLTASTTQSKIVMALAARTNIFLGNFRLTPTVNNIIEDESVSQEFTISVKQKQTIRTEKLISIYTSRDMGISEPQHESCAKVNSLENFNKLYEAHIKAWQYLWHRSDVEIQAPDDKQLITRLHIFHLLQSVSLNSVELDIGVPARGWHGEAYRGHVFWDELFIFPFYTYRIPEITRSLLLYRYRRLDNARELAKQEGYRGAMYPWQSASDGHEVTQVVHLNPRTNTWGPDYSRFQRHVNIAIVYNTWLYYVMTHDLDFLSRYGAEMILEIARFWDSITTYNKNSKRYEIHGVMGPDEYHEKYPDTDEPGINNNAYTNVMAVWVLERALKVLEIIHPDRKKELLDSLALNESELTRWQDIISKMHVPFHDDGIISQFDGYADLDEFDWHGYLDKYGNIERLDRILKGEGDSPDHYKVSKQADVLMLFYLLSSQEVARLFKQLGYEFTEEAIEKNINYYQKRTSHGSTLSKIVYASELDRIDRNAASSFFTEALISDISDIQGGTTPEGIHLGAMAGTVDIVMRHYAGVDHKNGSISFNPSLPEDITSLRLRVKHRRQWYGVYVDHQKFVLDVEKSDLETVAVTVLGEDRQLATDGTYEYPLENGRKEKSSKKSAG